MPGPTQQHATVVAFHRPQEFDSLAARRALHGADAAARRRKLAFERSKFETERAFEPGSAEKVPLGASESKAAVRNSVTCIQKDEAPA